MTDEPEQFNRIHVVDSHTGGEPTRVVVDGGPDLDSGSLSDRRKKLQLEFDSFRSAVVNEPRGSDAMVGALLCPPTNPIAVAGVVFFNNVGYLGMCVHGMIGVVQTLAHLNRIGPGEHIVETPVGDVQATLRSDGQVSVRNVVSYRHATRVELSVPDVGTVFGDIAWGGNWFFLVEEHGQRLSLDNIEQLTDFCWRIRGALNAQGITGGDGGEIDHVELFGPPTATKADSKNFVLCPGKAYDRSPCGTGTSAKLACLVADGKLSPGQRWLQESIVGTVFEGTADVHPKGIIPTIRGSAFITAEATLLLHPADPFRQGIRS